MPAKKKPSRNAPPRKNAPQRNAPQRNASQRNAPQRNAPQRNAPQRNASQRNASQQRERGVLFLNNRKNSSTHPDVTGSCEIGGIEYWISGWKNISKNGVKFTSLSFTQKDEQSNNSQPEYQEPYDNGTDDLPF